VHWAKQLRKVIEAAAKSGNVQAPVNVKRAVNVNRGNTTTTASADQHVEINQSTKSRPGATPER
jgi:hypothetical protein